MQEQLCTCLTRYEPGARRELDRVRDVLLEDLPPLCVSLVQRRDYTSAYIDLLRSYLMEVLGGAASLPPPSGQALLQLPGAVQHGGKACRSGAPGPWHPAALCGCDQLPGAGRLSGR